VLLLDGLRHSYVDLDDPRTWSSATRSASPTCWPSSAGAARRAAPRLGGGTLPRHLAASGPGSRSTVLEVDPQVPASTATGSAWARCRT
jgi:hypothetical protein